MSDAPKNLSEDHSLGESKGDGRSDAAGGRERPTGAPGVPNLTRSKAPSLSAHFHASRVRNDTWSALRLATQLAATRGRKSGTSDDDRAEIARHLELLEPIEAFWAFPGRRVFDEIRTLFQGEEWSRLARLTEQIPRLLISHSYRRHADAIDLLDKDDEVQRAELAVSRTSESPKSYFEVLVVDDVGAEGEEALREGLRAARRPEDSLLYEQVVVRSFSDALCAVLFNYNIQAVVVRYDAGLGSGQQLDVLASYLGNVDDETLASMRPAERATLLGRLIHDLRPELDLFLVTDASVEEAAGATGAVFRRVFYRQEDFLELHLSLLRGVRARRRTPFFKALREYAEQPTGVFHAMPISRGKSIIKSHWIRDMLDFYGTNIFLAETSATSGGLDSLLDPHGPIKEAQELAARAFGARKTYFVTNGTTGANKIVVGTLCRPGDIVLVDRDCHKSHHYALTLAGAEVIYLDAYPLDDYSMYGAVPLDQIVATLEELKKQGKLDRVKMLILTNCTFDGIVYHPARVMQRCLAIKPDLVFLWDEAWFGFARFFPTYRKRTAMDAADRLRARYRSAEYAERYANREEGELLPDPGKVRIRVYATQSTHKTLTALRQGSMIHVFDQDFHKVEGAFRDSYMTHTSTSPNYQILASLDIGRRQVELEGFEMVGKQVELALTLREKVAAHPLLRKWFRFLTIKDVIPEERRQSGATAYYDAERGWASMEDSWEHDEFVLDPTRLTLYVGATGVDGDTFKNVQLMQRHGIQVNKTSRNTVLFMTNIGTSRSSVAHLIDVLVRLAEDFEQAAEDESPFERKARERSVARLCEEVPPLPDFSRFHDAFRSDRSDGAREGQLRKAYYLGCDEHNCEYLSIDGGERSEIDRAMEGGREPVAASFLTPYPPGFPILVPGQVVSREILAYLRALDVKEIHGYRPELGLRVFTDEALDGAAESTAAGAT